jgi:mono/diheme cytochrome c family protein
MMNAPKSADRAACKGLFSKALAIAGLLGAMAVPLSTQAQTAPTPADIAAGKGEYAKWCASCHGGIPSSADKWRVHYATSSVMIESAIGRFAMMAPLAGNLSATAMTQIAAYIADTAGTGTGGTGGTATPQQALYNQYCGGCHGASPYAGQAKVNLGTTATVIQDAIAAIPSMQSAMLRSLTPTQLADIATFIADDVASQGATSGSGSTPTAKERGQTAYASMCAECHGANPASGREDIDKATSAAKTMSAIARNKGGMGKLSFLTQAQAEDIAVYVASTNPQSEGGGCTMARIEQPTDPIWPLMVGGALLVLLRRRIGRASH